MERVFIGIGANLGNRAANIEAARDALAALDDTELAAMSPVYETDPVGPVPQEKYLNAAAELRTELDPYDLLDALCAIEQQAGRSPESQRVKWGPRQLDLDILLFGSRVISSDELVVPHPMMHERWFVLKPLCDIAAGVVHPLLEMTVGDLLANLED